MSDEGPILEEAMDNLKETAQRIRATQNGLWSAGMDGRPDYRDLTHRVMT